MHPLRQRMEVNLGMSSQGVCVVAPGKGFGNFGRYIGIRVTLCNKTHENPF